MDATIQKANRTNYPASEKAWAIVLRPGKDTLEAVAEVLKNAGFEVRVWNGHEVLVLAPQEE